MTTPTDKTTIEMLTDELFWDNAELPKKIRLGMGYGASLEKGVAMATNAVPDPSKSAEVTCKQLTDTVELFAKSEFQPVDNYEGHFDRWLGASHMGKVADGVYMAGTIVEPKEYQCTPGDIVTMDVKAGKPRKAIAGQDTQVHVYKAAGEQFLAQAANAERFTAMDLAKAEKSVMVFGDELISMNEEGFDIWDPDTWYTIHYPNDMHPAPDDSGEPTKHPNRVKDGNVVKDRVYDEKIGMEVEVSVHMFDTYRDYQAYVDGARVTDVHFLELTGDLPMEFFATMDTGMSVEDRIPRKIEQISDLTDAGFAVMDLMVVYRETGLEVQNVFAYDVDAGYCWQYVEKENGALEYEGRDLKMRRVDGEIIVRLREF